MLTQEDINNYKRGSFNQDLVVYDIIYKYIHINRYQ